LTPLATWSVEALPFLSYRTPSYFDHPGAFFPETMYFWGGYAMDNYGWDRNGKLPADVDNHYIRWHWEGQVELLAMMLAYYDHTQDPTFLTETLIPLANPILTFFANHYARDAAGKLEFKPAQALETWQNVINPLPEIAGLHDVLDRLAALPEALATAVQVAAGKVSADSRV